MDAEELSVILYDEMMAKYKDEIPIIPAIEDRTKDNVNQFFSEYLDVSSKFSKKEGCEILKKINSAIRVEWVDSGYLQPENCITVRNVFRIILEEDTMLDGQKMVKGITYNFDLNFWNKKVFN